MDSPAAPLVLKAPPLLHTSNEQNGAFATLPPYLLFLLLVAGASSMATKFHSFNHLAIQQ